jgi:2-(1,2-epoxy-1,2-dihydrophenyl)acetyl-CoA isomerase
VWGLTKLILARTFESTMDDMFLLEGLGQIPAMGGPEFTARLTAVLDRQPLKPTVGDLLK